MASNLHMEGLSDEELLEFAEQSLASLRARYTDEDTLAEKFPDENASALAHVSIDKTCDHFDTFAELVRGDADG